MKECRSPYCECDKDCCTAPGFVDARHIKQGEEMAHVTFTKEQMDWLNENFNLELTSASDVLPVRDGFIVKGAMVWWHNANGPIHEKADVHHWGNIKNNPKLYSLNPPQGKYVYDYEE